MYQVGQWIIYGGEGACRVEAIGPLAMRGASRDRLYYTLAPAQRSGKVYVPVDGQVFTRPVLSREEAEALVQAIPDMEAPVCRERNLRLLTAHYQNLLNSHQCEDLVQIIKAAHVRRRERRSHGAKPGQVDERFLKRAEDLLYGELSVALGIGREQVHEYISQTVKDAEGQAG